MNQKPATPPVAWIETTASLEALAPRWKAARRLAVDTEANGFHAYRPRTCLIQVAWEEAGGARCVLVDPLALGGRLGPLAERLEDPGQEKILHGADNDVRLLARDCDVSLRGLVDTQICARLAGFARTGLVPLAAALLDARLSKAGQRLDWARRPLDRRAMDYAASDAMLLLPLREALVSRLRAMGRWAWAEEECRLLEKVRMGPEKPVDPYQLASRLKGAGALDGQARRVLLALVAWREEQARAIDRPAHFLVEPRTLLNLARQRPRSFEALSRAGLPPQACRRWGSRLLELIRDPPPPPPRLPRPARAPRPEIPAPRLEALKALRRRKAEELGLEEGTVLPTAVLREVAREPAGSPADLLARGMRQWQVGVLGKAILALGDDLSGT
ncbi:MAG: HRDC domain-containing protein [Acidobacteriota bacterium]|nr:HRDC domain-containing protein [Acidobacteriota bacterium]